MIPFGPRFLGVQDSKQKQPKSQVLAVALFTDETTYSCQVVQGNPDLLGPWVLHGSTQPAVRTCKNSFNGSGASGLCSWCTVLSLSHILHVTYFDRRFLNQS